MISLSGEANTASCLEVCHSSVPRPLICWNPPWVSLCGSRGLPRGGGGGVEGWGVPSKAGYECLWMVLGLVTHKTINPLNAVLCSIKTFCPLRQQISSLFSPLCLAHSHIHPQTLHHPVSEPPLVSQGDLWGRSRVRQASSAPGGVCHGYICIPGEPLDGVKKTSPVEPADWHIPNSVSPCRISSAPAIKRNEFFWGEVGCDLQDTYFTATNENVLAPRNQQQDAFSFLSRSSHETWERTGESVFAYCLAADDNVLLGEPEFGPTTWAGGGRCSLVAPVFVFLFFLFCFVFVFRLVLFVLVLRRSEDPTFVTETRGVRFWCGRRGDEISFEMLSDRCARRSR